MKISSIPLAPERDLMPRVRKSTKRAALVATTAAVAALVMYVFLTLPPAEPRYAGKKLSYWLPRVHNQALPQEQKSQVTRAVTTIGTDNLPLLLKWFREPEPPYREPWRDRAIDWVNSKQHLISLTMVRRESYHPSRPDMAFQVFNEFPSVAASAIPAFTNMFSDPDDVVKGKAALILGSIGEHALPTLSLMLTADNATNRSLAAFAIGNVGTNAVPLIPQLERLLNDKSPYPRLAAAASLYKLNAAPGVFVPTLLNCIGDGDTDTKAVAADVLAHTTNAGPLAVQALLQMALTNKNQIDRTTIYGALNSLDPEAAATIRANIFPGVPKAQSPPPAPED